MPVAKRAESSAGTEDQTTGEIDNSAAQVLVVDHDLHILSLSGTGAHTSIVSANVPIAITQRRVGTAGGGPA